MRIIGPYRFLGFGIVLTLSCGFVLSSNIVSADNDTVVDEINITVPVSCSLSGTGMNTHNASIINGTYTADIGSTTLKASCNDTEGFAIYAAGYTGDEIGGTNSNKLVGTSASSNATIDTGIATSAGNPDVSNWAMKLSTVSSPTPAYPITIDSAPNTSGGANASFSSYHVVPNEYTKVAHRDSGTDIGQLAEGSVLTTTYAVYASRVQPADTYTGQVIYTLVHPSTAPSPGPKSIDTATTLQEVTYCKDTLTIGQVYTLTDSRDNQSYKVARLADGKCWMLENLALDPTDATTAANMSADNTNASDEAISNYLNGGGTNTGWSNVAVVNKTSEWNSNSPNNARQQPYINNQSKNTLVTGYGPAAVNGQAKVGVYYNFCAATAGTYCTGQPDVIQDVCPANWQMPTRDIMSALWSEYNTTQVATDPASLQYNLSISLAGHFYDNSTSSQNDSIVLWFSSYSGDVLLVMPTRVRFAGSQLTDGSSIRCTLSD